MTPSFRALRARRRPPALSVVTLALCSTFATVTRATSDGGTTARLLAFAGPTQRHAIVAEVPFQSWCPKDQCTLYLYAVDTTASGFVPLEPREVRGHTYYDADDVLDRHALAERYVALTAGALNISSKSLDSPPPPLALAPHGENAVKGRRSDGTWFVVDRVVVAELASMSATDHDSVRSCVEHHCSSCKDVARDANGQRLMSQTCAAADGQWQDGAGKCRCDAKGAMVALRIAEAGAGASAAEGLFVGRQAAVEPFQLASNVSVADHRHETIDVAVTVPRLFAHETAAGAVVVTGALVHDPFGNGTNFPVVAVLPPGRRVTPGMDLGEPPEPPLPARESAAPPLSSASAAPAPTAQTPARVPPPTGCGGCVVGQRHGDTCPWWWVGLGWAWRRRRPARKTPLSVVR